MLLKILKNSHIRLLFTGSFFAFAFVYMAIYSYGVDEKVIKTFLIFSFMFVSVLIGVGFVAAVLIGLTRRAFKRQSFKHQGSGDLLDKIASGQVDEVDKIVGSESHNGRKNRS